MRDRAHAHRWTRHFVYRSERLRTTWTFRLGLVATMVAAVWLTSGWWTVAVARSLACQGQPARSDAIVIENFDIDNYLVFERAGELRRAGLAPRVLVPVMSDAHQRPNAVALGTTRLLTDLARVGDVDIVPIREVEPISLNAARDVLQFVEAQGLRSVVIVSPVFRSRRSALIYNATLGRARIRVTCEPVHGVPGPETWTQTSHGVQNVVEQWLKLQYYRLYVLPFTADAR